MKYALGENDQRIEALPKGRAVCPICRTVVIAKCGIHRIPHWAHQGLKNCDLWKEHETQWHRDWKNKFPVDWQEYVQHDEFGEKHIADVRTDQGLVIEFQHSPIDPKEREARERFHKNIVWVVDGNHRKRDFPRFEKGTRTFKPTNKQGHYFVPNPEKCFSAMWLNSPVAVFFDFLSVELPNPPNAIRDPLWQLLPHRVEGNGGSCGDVTKKLCRSCFQANAISPSSPGARRTDSPNGDRERRCFGDVVAGFSAS